MSDYRDFLEKTIGKEVMQQKFPSFYQMLVTDESAWQEQEVQRKKLGTEPFTKLSDLFYPAYLHYDSTTKILYGKVVLSTTSPYKRLNYVITVTDKNSIPKKMDILTYPEPEKLVQEQYHEYAFKYDMSKADLTDSFGIKFDVLAGGRKSGETTQFSIKLTRYQIEDIYNGVAEINRPVKNGIGKSETINVFYERYPGMQDMDVDYVFEDAKRPNKRIEILLPVNGRIALKDNKSFACYVNDDVYKAVIDFKKGGIVYSNPAGCDLSETGDAEVEWSFATDWNGTLERGVFNPDNTCELTMQLRYCLTGAVAAEVSTMFASSLIEKDDFLDCKKMRELRLCLGCVAKGTKVTMADGCERPIESIQIGDRLAISIDGRWGEVTNTWKGREETLVCVELENDRKLCITELHYMMTERGMIPAGKLNGNDRIMTLDGLVPIKYLYEIPYNDTVYNLDVVSRDGEHGNMICEGMLITDNMNMRQNAAKEEHQRVVLESSEEGEILREMIELTAYLNSLTLNE